MTISVSFKRKGGGGVPRTIVVSPFTRPRPKHICRNSTHKLSSLRRVLVNYNSSTTEGTVLRYFSIPEGRTELLVRVIHRVRLVLIFHPVFAVLNLFDHSGERWKYGSGPRERKYGPFSELDRFSYFHHSLPRSRDETHLFFNTDPISTVRPDGQNEQSARN